MTTSEYYSTELARELTIIIPSDDSDKGLLLSCLKQIARLRAKRVSFQRILAILLSLEPMPPMPPNNKAGVSID